MSSPVKGKFISDPIYCRIRANKTFNRFAPFKPSNYPKIVLNGAQWLNDWNVLNGSEATESNRSAAT